MLALGIEKGILLGVCSTIFLYLWRTSRPQLRHLVLICIAINFIDASALETLTNLVNRLHDAGIQLYLTEVKGPLMDRLARTEFLEQLGHEPK